MIRLYKRILYTMNKNLLLDLYKVYSLKKISSLSEKNLAMQYEQCGQIIALRKQIEKSDITNKRILENQIKELERQEKVRYYKNLICNLQAAVDVINSIDDIAFKSYICIHYNASIDCLANECAAGLEEIADKTFANQVVNNNLALKKECEIHRDEYLLSIWNKFEEANKLLLEDDISKKKINYNVEIKKIDEEISKLQEELDQPLSFLMRSSKKASLQQAISKKKEQKSEIEGLIENLLQKQQTIQENANNCYLEVSKQRPNWENEIDKITCLLPKPVKRTMLAGKEIDALFEKAAMFVVSKRTAAISMIQRQFELGYHRATLIMNQLEDAGIVGPLKEKDIHDVIVYDDEDVADVMNTIKSR